MAPAKVLIVGAGATGACTALRLRRLLGREVSIEVWEKARGPGGRMSTNRQELEGTTVRADMGAQYLSLDGADADCAEVADLLVKEGVCAEVPAKVLSDTAERSQGKSWRHLAGTGGGVNDALKLLLEQAGAEPHYERRVASLDEQHGRWRARPFDGAPGVFDAVVLAVPGCGVGGDNLNKIRGGWEGAISAEQNKQLLAVEHDHRWSFALFLPLECAARCDAFFGPEKVEKVVEDGTLHVLCYQSRKTSRVTGTAPTGGLVVVAHTTLAWAKRNSRASGRDERLLREVSEKVASALGLEGAISRVMLGSKVITWKQSQVTKPIPLNAATGPCMLLSAAPPLLLAGDYFAESSSFGGCLTSACAAGELLAKVLKGECPASILDAAGADAGSGKDGRAKGVKRKGEGGGKGKAADGGKGWSSQEGKGYRGSRGYYQDNGGWDDSWDWGDKWGGGGGGKSGKGKGGKKGYSSRPYVGA